MDKVNTPEFKAALDEEKAFVESLSNPYNIHQLAVEGLLLDPHFLEYMALLERRWSQPEWHRALLYPLGVEHLRLLCADSTMRHRALEVGFASQMMQLQKMDLTSTM